MHAKKVMLNDMLAGEGELAQHIISWLPLRVLARLALVSSPWSAEVVKGVLLLQRWERYHNILAQIKALVPMECDFNRQQLVTLVDSIDRFNGPLDAEALANLRAGRPFAFPPSKQRSVFEDEHVPCFEHRLCAWPWGTKVASGAATDIAYFFSIVLPAAFQDELHEVFRAIALRLEVPAFVALLEQASLVMNASHFCSVRKHTFVTRGFALTKPKLLVEYREPEGSLGAVFAVPHGRRPLAGHSWSFRELPRCKSEWSLFEIVDAIFCIGFDVELLDELLSNLVLPTASTWRVEVLQALVVGGRVFGVLPEQEVAATLHSLFTFEDDAMDDLAGALRDGGRVLYPASMIAILLGDYIKDLYEMYKGNRYNREVEYTLQEDVVEKLADFLYGISFPTDFCPADRQPILDALKSCNHEVKEGMRGVALGWVHGYVGAGGSSEPSFEAIGSVRAICEALL